MNWYIEVLKKYAVFSGRARRKEYWYFVLFSTLIAIVLAIIDGVTGSLSAEAGIGLLSGIYALGVLIPSIAVGVRRLHDTNRSGWWLLIALIPIIGAIVLLVFLADDSKPEENQMEMIFKTRYGNHEITASVSRPVTTSFRLSLDGQTIAESSRPWSTDIICGIKTWFGLIPVWEIWGSIEVDGAQHRVTTKHYTTFVRQYVEIFVDGQFIGPEQS